MDHREPTPTGSTPPPPAASPVDRGPAAPAGPLAPPAEAGPGGTDLPTAADLRSMAVDLDDIDDVLARLDADPESVGDPSSGAVAEQAPTGGPRHGPGPALNR